MPKYTKLLPPQEYEKLTLDEKAEYIVAMAELLRPRGVRPASPATNPPPDDEPNPRDQAPPAPVDSDPNPPHQEPPAPVDHSPHQEPPARPDTNPPPDDKPKNS